MKFIYLTEVRITDGFYKGFTGKVMDVAPAYKVEADWVYSVKLDGIEPSKIVSILENLLQEESK